MLRASTVLAVGLFVVASVGGAEEILQDDFSDVDASRELWQFVHGPSEFADGVLVQRCAIAGQTARAVLAGTEAWEDCEVECRFRFIKCLSDRGGHAGIRLRESNGRFLYVFVGGAETSVCWAGFGPARARRRDLQKRVWHHVRIVCKGSTVRVTVDHGDPIVIESVPYPRGAISLHSYQVEAAFDDVRARNLGPVQPIVEREPGPNLMQNSSFEYATAPNLPDCWGPGGWGLNEEEWVVRLDELWSRWRRDREQPFHGQYCLRVDGIRRATSTIFYPQVGERYTLSAYVRSSVDRAPVELRYYNWTGSMWHRTVRASTQWTRVVWRLPKVQTNQGMVSFRPQSDHVLWVDAVQFEMGTEANAYRPDSFGPQSATPEQQSRPATRAVRAKATPAIDGRLDEDLWQGATPLALGLQSGGVPRRRTTAYVAFDGDCVYVGFRCYDSQMNQVRANVVERDGHAWTDDSVEIFIGPAGPRGDWSDYFHLAISITGARYDAVKMDPSWDRDWRAATARFPDRWEVEVALPFAMFDLCEFNQGDWLLNLCRENPKIGEYSCWSPTHGSFHKAERFGILKAFPKPITSRWLRASTDQTQTFIPPSPLVVDGKPFLPFGVSWSSNYVPGADSFRVLKQAGMNALVMCVNLNVKSAEQNHKALALAQTHGIKVIYWISGTGGIDSPRLLPEIRKAITEFRRQPAVAAWMVLDEPHSHAENVIAACRLGKELDPTRPSFINVTPHGLGMRIAGLPGDVVMVDRYTIHFDGSRICDIGPVIRQANREAAGKRPVWIFLQGMSHALWVWRGPTPAEHTAQTYTALVNGATGIIYFNGIIWPTDTWQRTQELAREVRQLQPVLFSSTFGKTTCSSKAIEYVCKQHDGRWYLLAVNPMPKAYEVDFDLRSVLADDASVVALFEGRTLRTQEQRLRDRFEPYERHCYALESQGHRR